MTSRPWRKLTRSLTAAAALVVVLSSLNAEDITWNSANFVDNFDSTGTPLDDSYSFYLGVFDVSPGMWTPSPANTADWAGYWVTVDVAEYEMGSNPGFTGGYDVEASVEGVTLSGKQAYIWGVNRRCPGEWILVTNPAWTYPPPGFVFPKTWAVSLGDPIIGAVNEGGVHIRTALVTDGLPPLLKPEMWRRLYFSAP